LTSRRRLQFSKERCEEIKEAHQLLDRFENERREYSTRIEGYLVEVEKHKVYLASIETSWLMYVDSYLVEHSSGPYGPEFAYPIKFNLHGGLSSMLVQPFHTMSICLT